MPYEPDHTRVVGVDTGGTFTDFVFMEKSGAVRVDKRPSNPADPAVPVLEGLALFPGATHRVVHGTTVATNALLEHKTAPVALITTAGFEDVLEIGRQNRPVLYAAHPRKPPPLVPRRLRFGVTERILYDGTVRTSLEPAEAEDVLTRIKDLGVGSVAVCLLHSYVNPIHEETIGEIARRMGLVVSLSCRVLPEFREYERTATVVVNACLRPIMEGYIGRLEQDLGKVRLSVMQSAGGIIPARMAARLPVHTVLSGPAGGVIASAYQASLIGLDRLITFDMGGTSTDVSLYDGGPSLTGDKLIAGYPIRVPVVDIHTVGAGGGSIAYRDEGGGLKVGPVSAGADPGPVCYGKGESVTVTDANLFLGRLEPSFFLGGRMRVYPDRVRGPMEALARSLALNPSATAEGIVTVVNSVMERAVRVISIQQGRDPRDFTLVSFGGAGGLHAVELARALSIPRVMVPKNAGVFSAFGMSVADVIRDVSRTILTSAQDASETEINAVFNEMALSGSRDLIDEGIDGREIQVLKSMDMRYEGQSYEINAPLSRDPVAAFHGAHENLYGYARPESVVEIVTLRIRLIVTVPKPVQRDGPREPAESRPRPMSTGRVIHRGREVPVHVYDRENLPPGSVCEGPALICESSSTTFLPPGSQGMVDALGNIMIRVG
ncbi:MAG: hydantoinase/oxoprolinase family protein [Desulfomonilaceae bacterium]|nr:hydantoinase/oxoprolinase family protein [Desulfomonilaceae bacterium]